MWLLATCHFLFLWLISRTNNGCSRFGGPGQRQFQTIRWSRSRASFTQLSFCRSRHTLRRQTYCGNFSIKFQLIITAFAQRRTCSSRFACLTLARGLLPLLLCNSVPPYDLVMDTILGSSWLNALAISCLSSEHFIASLKSEESRGFACTHLQGCES